MSGKKQLEKKMDNLLSMRERDVLKLIVGGFTNREIASHLYISAETVKSHRKHILQKTNCRNSAALANYILMNNLI
jgi:DNA-binding NarL/FixJ family response regulator